MSLVEMIRLCMKEAACTTIMLCTDRLTILYECTGCHFMTAELNSCSQGTESVDMNIYIIQSDLELSNSGVENWEVRYENGTIVYNYGRSRKILQIWQP